MWSDSSHLASIRLESGLASRPPELRPASLIEANFTPPNKVSLLLGINTDARRAAIT